MNLPTILSEDETLAQALAGKSISRFGDGELRLAAERGTCISQRDTSKKLVAELRSILASPPENCLVCLPRFGHGPKAEDWARYSDRSWRQYFGPGPYGSAFISRPDSAPWIDEPEYWHLVEDLWRDKDIIFVGGSDRSLRDADFATARSLARIAAPKENAYAQADRIESDIMCARLAAGDSAVVILCLGVTATVLAARLAARKVHALDLGHIGMFRRHQGAYRYTLDDLASHGYRQQLAAAHRETKGWGADGKKHADAARAFAAEIGAHSVLDYGCGQGKLAAALKDSGLKVHGWDIGIPGKDTLPKPADLVVCSDVLEHVEPKKLDNVLDHIWRLAGKGMYLVIATRPANATLPNGKNAHLIIWTADQWMDRITQLDVAVKKSQIIGNHEVRLWLTKSSNDQSAIV